MNPFGRLISRSTGATQHRDWLLGTIDSVRTTTRPDGAETELIALETLEAFLRETLPTGQLAGFATTISRRRGPVPAYVAELAAVREPVERLAVQLERVGGRPGPEQAATLGRCAYDVIVRVRRLLDAFDVHSAPVAAMAGNYRDLGYQKRRELLKEWADLQARFWPNGDGPDLDPPGPPRAQQRTTSLSDDVAHLGLTEERSAVFLRWTSAGLYLVAGAIATWILLGLPNQAAELPVEVAKLAITIPLVLLARQYAHDAAECRLVAADLRRTRLQLDHFDEYWPDISNEAAWELRVDLWKRLEPTRPSARDGAEPFDIDKVTELIKTILGR